MSSEMITRERQMRLKAVMRKLDEVSKLNAAAIEERLTMLDTEKKGLSNTIILEFVANDEKTIREDKFRLLEQWAIDSMVTLLKDKDTKRLILSRYPDFFTSLVEADPFQPKPVFVDSKCTACGRLTPGETQHAKCCIHCGAPLQD